MKPIDFTGSNSDLGAAESDGGQSVPAFVNAGMEVTTCWKLSWRERLIVLLAGRVWLVSCTMGADIQPQVLSVGRPDEGPDEPAESSDEQK